MPPKKRAQGAGTTRQLPSGRWQARHRGEDGIRRSAPVTFDTKLDALAWLGRQSVDIERGTWAPAGRAPKHDTLRVYADSWLAGRDLAPRTRLEYRRTLDANILPTLSDVPLDRMTPATVRTWYGQLNASTPTKRAHAYALLRTIYSTAVADDLVPANPCRIRGAGSAKTVHRPKVATPAELDVIGENIVERFRALVLLAAWCALRFGELTELRRHDLDLDAERPVLRVERGVTRTVGSPHVGAPKTDAGRRSVTIPPHIIVALREHLERHVEPAGSSLLFPARKGGHLCASTWQKAWEKARASAGRPDLHLHDLRHTGATAFAATGAPTAAILRRMGHTTVQTALIYQHPGIEADAAGAEAMSAAEGTRLAKSGRRNSGAE